MPIYINSWEHYSSLFSSCYNFADQFTNLYEKDLSDNIYTLNEPSDLYDFINVRGTKSKDNFTKAAVYIAKKLYKNNIKSERLGVVFATEYGNINSMCELSNLGKSSTEPISAQLFPNATISSATVTVSIYLKAQGLNLTINSGNISFYQAIMIACNYINAGKIDACIVLTGDDYNQFAREDISLSDIQTKKFLSTINGVMLNKNKIEGGKNFIIENVEINKLNSEFTEDKNSIYSTGYRCGHKDFCNKINIPDIYIGPSIGFVGLLNCFRYLENNSNVNQCKAAVVDDNLYSSITISRDKL